MRAVPVWDPLTPSPRDRSSHRSSGGETVAPCSAHTVMVIRSLLALALVAACSNADGPGDPDGGRDAAVGTDASSTDASPADAMPLTDGGGMDAAPDSGFDAGPIDPSLSFFVTSSGNGANGGNYGGLAGADARCQALASAVGAGGRTWRAYLSTSGGGPTVNARDRIGSGPWFNARGEEVAAGVDALHTTGIPSTMMLTELGTAVPSSEHDILTGTMENGNAWTEFPGNPAAPPPNCFNWTSNDPNAYTYVGHEDWDVGSGTWNAAHEVTCDEAGLRGTAGSGRLYCFAAD